MPDDTAFASIVRPNPPFRLDLTVWALRRRPRNKIDRWDGVTYRRVIAVCGRSTELAIRQEGPLTGPRLIVAATPSLRTSSERQFVRSVIDRLLGLRIDLCDWYRLAEGHHRLRMLATTIRGHPRGFVNCAASADGRPNTYCYEVLAVSMSSPATTSGHRRVWLGGSVGRLRWITPA